jgi:hypothetical protein
MLFQPAFGARCGLGIRRRVVCTERLLAIKHVEAGLQYTSPR